MTEDSAEAFREMLERIMNYGEPRPAPADLLYRNLIENKTADEVLTSATEGCEVILKNARRLVGDADCLIEQSRFASASMLSATVEEEIAKVLLLIDLSRLDFEKRRNIAKELCRAFCNHTAKAARFALFKNWSSIGSMGQAKTHTAYHKIEWFPADEDTGQPDLASAHAYRRDHSLYADIDWTNGQWCLPDDKWSSSFFESTNGASWSESVALLEQLERNLSAGLLSITVIQSLHQVYSPYFLDERSDDRVKSLLDDVLRKVVANGVVSSEALDDAPALLTPPMYAFIGKSLENLRRGRE